MAIDITQEPEDYASMHEELWHAVESTNVTTAGFQYVFDIYKDGSLLTRIKNTPYPINDLGILDASPIIRNFVPTPILPSIDILERRLYISWTDYEVHYGEICGQVFTSGIVTASYRAYDRYNRRPWDKLQSNVNGAMILSNRPAESYWYEGHPVALSVFYVSGQTYDFNRRNTDTNSILSTINYNPSPNGDSNELFLLNPLTDNMTFELSGSTAGIIGTRKIKKKCSKYDKHTLVFLNAFGGWDSFTFVHGKYMMENEKKKFEQFRFGEYNRGIQGKGLQEKDLGLNTPASQYFQSMKTYANKYRQKMQLTSDILSSGEWDWLFELTNSPVVFYYDIGESISYPVQITDTNYELKDDLINKADTLQVNIDFSISNYTQFR